MSRNSEHMLRILTEAYRIQYWYQYGTLNHSPQTNRKVPGYGVRWPHVTFLRTTASTQTGTRHHNGTSCPQSLPKTAVD